MTCGDKYKTRFTATNWNNAGPWTKPRTWDDPWFGHPGPLDYRAWKLVAQQATDAMWDALEHLGQVEKDLGHGFPKWNELNDAAVIVYNRRNELPTFFAVDLEEPAQDAVAIVRDAACQLELINDAIAGYGRKPITAPGDKTKPEPSWMDTAMTWGVVAAMAVGVWYLERNSDSSEGGG